MAAQIYVGMKLPALTTQAMHKPECTKQLRICTTQCMSSMKSKVLTSIHADPEIQSNSHRPSSIPFNTLS